MILLTMITYCCAFPETEMLRLTDHHSIITYHFSANRAVSSVVERLVYTERVGGSKPSPPTLHFDLQFAICDIEMLRVLATNVGVE